MFHGSGDGPSDHSPPKQKAVHLSTQATAHPVSACSLSGPSQQTYPTQHTKFLPSSPGTSSSDLPTPTWGGSSVICPGKLTLSLEANNTLLGFTSPNTPLPFSPPRTSSYHPNLHIDPSTCTLFLHPGTQVLGHHSRDFAAVQSLMMKPSDG